MTQRALAAICGISATRVRQLVAEGIISKNSRGKYSDTAITQYIDFLRAQTEESSDYKELLEQERWREKKRENDLAEGLVAPVEVLQSVVSRGVSAMIPILESLPLIVKRHFPEITGDQIQLVKKAVAECRNALADVEVRLDDD